MVEARGSLGKLSAKAHGPYGEKTKKKERGRSNNLLMQDINAILHENKKNVLFLFTSFF